MNDSVNQPVSGSLPSRAPAEQGAGKGREQGEDLSIGHPIHPPSSTSTRDAAPMDGWSEVFKVDPGAIWTLPDTEYVPALRPLAEIRADLEAADWILRETPGVDPGLVTRLIRDVPALLAALECPPRVILGVDL